ncbi:hypothetical protein [Kutzneria sp. CA-103260]|uniref:hypothetical protein n=1 Tax=Kutzneria sp. CA-103260 TaxID=2802641 RepID=UPI001BAB6DCF|nr:hypothetical protein [Kutzneria sp. CA-103260]QUQ70096.1 hypothetical protein JJ691_78670 [Kutzneria sp. CA-103260]
MGFAALVTLAACGGPQAAAPAPTTGAPVVTDAVQLAAMAKTSADKTKSVDIDAVINQQQTKIQMTGAALVDGANTQIAMKMSADSGDAEVRVVDKAVYISLPADARGKQGISTPWLKLGGGDDPVSKALAGGFDQMAEQNSPTSILDELSKAGKITKSWQTTLNGQPVTHYALVLDTSKAGQAAQLPADEAAKLPKTADIDVWINSDQLPVQVVMTMGDLLTSTMHYTNWGAKVDVAAPPADQVTDIAKLKH